jgi:death-on-curing family protein
MDPLFLSLDEVLEMHQQQIDRYGGSSGIRDSGGLQSAIATPQATFGGEYLHPSIPAMAAAYLFHICQNHAFIDGNKRVGANAAIAFLLMNDWEPDFQPDELSDLVLSVASGAVDKAALTALFELHEANAAMTRMLVPILEQVRNLIGPRRRVMIVFDRGGWSPKLFQKLLAMGFDIMTYRKGRVRRIAEKRFVLRTAKLDGRPVKYLLPDQPVRFLRGKLRLRQVTRLTDNGKQTPILTSRWDLRDVVVAYRMFERWRQENFFKYMRQEFLIDALCDYQVEPDDPERSVPHPARKAVDKELRKARARWNQLKQTYGDASLDYIEGRTPTMREFQAADKKIYQEIREAAERVAELAAQQKLLPLRVPLAEARPDQDLVKLSTERKHLTNVLKLVAYQIESDLVHLLVPTMPGPRMKAGH